MAVGLRYLAIVALVFGAAPASAAELADLASGMVARGAHSHPYLGPDAPEDPLVPAAAMAVDPAQPFSAWIAPGPSGMASVLRAGARAVNPGADAAAPPTAALADAFSPYEEWALWATDAVINLARARALEAAAKRIDRRAKRAGAPDAMAGARAWTAALRQTAEGRFRLAFDRDPPRQLRWAALTRAKADLPRTRNMTLTHALSISPGMGAAAPIGDPAVSHGRIEMQELEGVRAINSALGGAIGADGTTLGVKLRLGFVPGGRSYASAPGRDGIGDRAADRNALRTLIVERIGAAFDARRAASAHIPILGHRIKRLGALLDGFRGAGDEAGATQAATRLWIDEAAAINALHADDFAVAQILAASGRLFDALYTGGDAPRGAVATAVR